MWRNKRHSQATLIDVDIIVKRPHKIYIETRRSKDGYSVTIVTRDASSIARIMRNLKILGYKDFTLHMDKYGFIRMHYSKNLTHNDIIFIKKLVYDSLHTDPENLNYIVH